MAQRFSLSAIALRLLLSAVATGVVLFVACAALFVTHAPPAVSLLIEPFSLLLLPGLLVALVFSGTRDFSAIIVLQVATVFYLLFFFSLSLRWPRTRNRSL